MLSIESCKRQLFLAQSIFFYMFLCRNVMVTNTHFHQVSILRSGRSSRLKVAVAEQYLSWSCANVIVDSWCRVLEPWTRYSKKRKLAERLRIDVDDAMVGEAKENEFDVYEASCFSCYGSRKTLGKIATY
jgi:hypothetical protein